MENANIIFQYFVMDAYDKLLQHGPTGTEGKIPKGHDSIHTNHCFDYLRQAILCTLDTTLEGAVPGKPGGTNGFGHTHVCKNYHEVVDWIEGRRVSDPSYIINPNA